ncbi:MAG TPA: PAS domain S-box protein [Thermoanaerobaculia bacterium]|nr:PAS domain S-box protein [Thermoanaerobaculia bacterium]
MLALGIGASLFLWQQRRDQLELGAAARMQRAVRRVTTALQSSLGTYESTLRGGAGFFANRDEVTESEFRSYWRGLGFADRDAGVASLAFIVPVRRADLAAYLDRRRVAGPALHLQTSGERDDLFLIQLYEGNEPETDVVGLDTGAVPANREALEQARDLGLARLAAPIRFRDPTAGPAMAIQYPVFRGPAGPVSVEERRERILGWVSLLVRIRPVMEGILRDEDIDIAVSLHDGAAAGPSAVLYAPSGPEAPPGALRVTAPLELGGHRFALTFAARPGFKVTQETSRSRDLLTAGLLMTGLLFGIIWSLTATKAHAVALAGRMTASLRASEQRYARLFEQSLAGIYRTTPEGRILECNEAFARLYGYESRQDLLDQSAVALHENGESRQRFLETLREKGTLIAYESRARRKDGTLFWTLEHVSLLPGPPEVVEGTIVDISERKKAEEALRVSEERYRSLFEHSRDGLYFFDLDSRRILESNPAFRKMMGYTGDELRGRLIYEIILGDRASVDANVERLRNERLISIGERRYRRRDGKPLAVEIEGVRIEEGGRPLVLAVVHYLADRRALEEQLRQAQKMEAIGRLAGGIAHDFNNLLTAILGYAELVLDSKPPADVGESVGEIRKAGERAAALTKQLLAFSRKQVLQPKILDLNAVLAETDSMLRRVLGEDVTFVAERDPHLWRVQADPDQVQQVLLNLAVNARDAMPEGGVLRVATRNVSLEAGDLAEVPKVAEGAYVLVEVTDTGHGMDAETLSHAFEPFFTTKERGKGTGLGLSTVYGIVKQSGGYVHIESEPGKGTRVLVYLARVHGTADSPSDASLRAVPLGGNETILLVEDEESVRRLTSLLLERSGYRLLVASSAEEALQTARAFAGEIDLLLTDVVLPGLNGRRLADLLRVERPRTKIVFASGYFDESGVLDPGSDFIQKPFNPETLTRSIRRALDRGRPAQA